MTRTRIVLISLALLGAAMAQTWARAADSPFQSNSVTVASVDVEVYVVQAPNANVDSTASVTPSVRVRNDGDNPATFSVLFTISKDSDAVVYVDTTQVVNLPTHGNVGVAFATWLAPHALGAYTGFCRTLLTGDQNPANDTMSNPFNVVRPTAPIDTGWRQMADFPFWPSGKRVKDGGTVCAGRDSTGDVIYAFKGGNTFEFYAYNITTNTWLTREPIPAIDRNGKKKAPKKGAALAYDRWNNKVYATKANNTLEFWTFDIATGVWTQQTDVPAGGKRIKDGSDMIFKRIARSTYRVFLLKGSNTTEFYAYDVAANSWSALTYAPGGVSGKAYRDGSAMADADFIYVLKGGYNELYAYDSDLGTWSTRAAMPLVGASGRKKKTRAGAAMDDHNGFLYALKGNNTREFWRYECDSNRWVQLSDMPFGSGKQVKGGGGLAIQGSAAYCTKGNNTLEFWRYGIPPTAAQLGAPAAPNALTGAAYEMRKLALHARPNPLTSSTTISYSLPRADNVSLKLYDVTGKLVATLATGFRPAGTSSLVIQRSSIRSGIHLLELETGNTTTTTKLIVE